MKVRHLAFTLVLVLILLGVGIGYIVLSPSLVSVSPRPGEEDVMAASPVQLTFSRGMQADSVEERLVFKPERTGGFLWEENTLTFKPDQPWASGEEISVRLEAGARSAGFIPLAVRDSTEWTFTISQSRLLYLFPMDGLANLFAYDPNSDETQQLTFSTSGLLDFSTSLDGRLIYFSERNSSGGSDIYLIDRLVLSQGETGIYRLLACPQALCHTPQVSLDGAMLAYEREPLPESGQPLFTQVWLLELSGENKSVPGDAVQYLAGDDGHATMLPSWSSTGWLSFYDLSLRAFILLNPVSNERLEFPNETGEPGAWSPDGEAFIAPEIIFTPAPEGMEEFSQMAASHLMRFDLNTQEIRNLSQGVALEDTFPSFSPDGSRLAFTRRFLDEHRWTLGRQIWVMVVDSGETEPLTSSPSFNHYGIAWSPGGDRLVYLRFNLDRLTDPGELWLVELKRGEQVQIITGGYSPRWIP